jgi:hypothetical protein
MIYPYVFLGAGPVATGNGRVSCALVSVCQGEILKNLLKESIPATKSLACLLLLLLLLLPIINWCVSTTVSIKNK